MPDISRQWVFSANHRPLQYISSFSGKVPGNLPEDFRHVRIGHTSLFELPSGFCVDMSTNMTQLHNVIVIHPGAQEYLSEVKELRCGEQTLFSAVGSVLCHPGPESLGSQAQQD